MSVTELRSTVFVEEPSREKPTEGLLARIRRAGRLASLIFGGPGFTELERIELAKRGAWLGKTTWYVPGMASNPVSTLPDTFEILKRDPEEIRAALVLKLISRAALTASAWEAAQAVPEAKVPDAAIRLLKALKKARSESHIDSTTNPVRPTTEERN